MIGRRDRLTAAAFANSDANGASKEQADGPQGRRAT